MAESLGIVGYDSFHFVVEDLDRSHTFYTEKLGFTEVARSGAVLSERSGQASRVYGAGEVRVVVSAARADHSKAARYLQRHPAGIMSLSFVVEDLERTQKLLEARGATLLADPFVYQSADGSSYKSFEIATPLGDVAYRFVQREGFTGFAPEFDEVGPGHNSRPVNEFGITSIDHITSNCLTMQPVVSWYAQVLGFEQFWDIEFHTEQVFGKQGAMAPNGSGLKSIVMWDPESGIKFATNEPLRPNFRGSQITKFIVDNHGPGVQHVALGVTSIIDSVTTLQQREVEFMKTPPSYFNDLPRRLQELKISNVKEDLATLEKLQILVDGSDDKYMLQIFMREAAGLYDQHRAGPFFYELIQRAGDPGFGYGNFRALFESIERAQRAEAARLDG